MSMQPMMGRNQRVAVKFAVLIGVPVAAFALILTANVSQKSSVSAPPPAATAVPATGPSLSGYESLLVDQYGVRQQDIADAEAAAQQAFFDYLVRIGALTREQAQTVSSTP